MRNESMSEKSAETASTDEIKTLPAEYVRRLRKLITDSLPSEPKDLVQRADSPGARIARLEEDLAALNSR